MLNLPAFTFTNAWIHYNNVQKLMQVGWYLIHTQPRKLNHEVPRLAFPGRPTGIHNTIVSTHGLGISNAKVLLYSHLRPSIGSSTFYFQKMLHIHTSSKIHYCTSTIFLLYFLPSEKNLHHCIHLNTAEFLKRLEIGVSTLCSIATYHSRKRELGFRQINYIILKYA